MSEPSNIQSPAAASPRDEAPPAEKALAFQTRRSGWEKAAKAVLTLNIASLIRLIRFGAQDCSRVMREAYAAIDPFQKTDDISQAVRTYCVGQGVEIGPGTLPYCDPANTTFVDKFDYPIDSIPITKIKDAWELPFDAHRFDFLLASHCLEHCPDTIRTLLEWKRVLRPGGKFILLSPHGLRTFDRGRALTRLPHHLEDFEKQVDVYDVTHWEEFERISIRAQHHWWLDLPEAWLPNGQINVKWALENGCYHYHVWTPSEMIDVLRHLKFDILLVADKVGQRNGTFMIIAEAAKGPSNDKPS